MHQWQSMPNCSRFALNSTVLIDKRTVVTAKVDQQHACPVDDDHGVQAGHAPLPGLIRGEVNVGLLGLV
jgi:hypothetical protein